MGSVPSTVSTLLPWQRGSPVTMTRKWDPAKLVYSVKMECAKDNKVRLTIYSLILNCNVQMSLVVILVTGGWKWTGLSSVEVLSPAGTPLTCSLPPLPSTDRYRHTQDGLVACGGAGGGARTSCATLTAAGWAESQLLGQERQYHTSWRSPAGLLLLGGEQSPTTTELLSSTDSTTSTSITLEYSARLV